MKLCLHIQSEKKRVNYNFHEYSVFEGILQMKQNYSNANEKRIEPQWTYIYTVVACGYRQNNIAFIALQKYIYGIKLQVIREKKVRWSVADCR